MIGSFEKLVYSLVQKVFLLSFGAVVFLSPESSNRKDEHKSFLSSSFLVDFSHFSPAFSVLEDEFLLEAEFPKAVARTPDQKKQTLTNPNPVGRKPLDEKKSINQNLSHWINNQDFDGKMKLTEISRLIKPSKKKSPVKISNAGELGEGSLFEEIKKTDSLKTDQKAFSALTPLSKEINIGPPFETRVKNQKQAYRISGELFLKEGLAFIGDMEIRWILSNHTLNYGSIDINQGTYEIKVDQLSGDLVVSIYDKKNNPIGRGSIALNQLENTSTQILKNIEIFPIKWNYAGQVVDGGLLGNKNSTLSGVNISLYGFEVQSQTNKQGQFSFQDWKKLDSRSIALAEKSGYYDSVFIIDSETPVSVPLFPKSYIDSFFSYLEDQGLDEVRKGGVVYGSIEGVKDKDGYSVSIANQSSLSSRKPVYFFPVGLPNLHGTATSSNGLFSFTGLEAGDYQLTIEKKDQIVDQKWVVVESGRVSSVFSPLNQSFSEDQNIPDGVHLSSFKKTSLFNPEGISGTRDHSEAFYKKLHQLAENETMQTFKGLVFGFINSSEKYQVTLLEESPKKIIYFNSKAQVIDPHNEIADGFIMGGFSKGLKSLTIQNTTDNMVLATELVFSDHESTSLVNTSVHPVEI